MVMENNYLLDLQKINKINKEIFVVFRQKKKMKHLIKNRNKNKYKI